MKKIGIILCLCSMLAAVPGLAADKKKGLVQTASGQGYGMAGCGLGSILFGEQPGMIQIIAATFNNTQGNQTFGITSGTSNCVDEGQQQRTAALFITANREALEKDISRGSGESVATLSEIMGCGDAQAFGTKLQSNYSRIFPDQNVSTDSVVSTIQSMVKSCS